MIIVTFSDPEEQVVEKIKAVLAEDQEIESISIADGKEIRFGDVEIQTKQRKVFLKGKEIELTTREFDVLYTGEAAERGTFDRLIDRHGFFYSLFTVSQ